MAKIGVLNLRLLATVLLSHSLLSTRLIVDMDRVKQLICTSQRLSESQRAFCNNETLKAYFMNSGTTEASMMCKYLTSLDLHNCADGTFTKLSMMLDDGGSKESAFISAMRGAGLIMGLLQGYFNGILPCPDPNFSSRTYDLQSRQTIWQMTPCSTAAEFAMEDAMQFIDMDDVPPKFGPDTSRLLLNHNARLGMTIVQDSLIRRCQAIPQGKSCLTDVPDMETLGKILYSKYQNARRVVFHPRSIGNPGFRYHVTTDFSNLPKQRSMARNDIADIRDMVYAMDSEPYNLYCASHKARGRLCYRHVEGDSELRSYSGAAVESSCRRLCCRQTKRLKVEVERTLSCAGCLLDLCQRYHQGQCRNVTVTYFYCPG